MNLSIKYAWERQQIETLLLAVEKGESVSYAALMDATKSPDVTLILRLVRTLRKSLRRRGYVFNAADGRTKTITRQTLDETSHSPERSVVKVKRITRVAIEEVGGAVLPHFDQLPNDDKHRVMNGMAKLGLLAALSGRKKPIEIDEAARAVKAISERALDEQRKRQLLAAFGASA